MKNRDTSLGAIFIYCRTRCETNGRNVAKCDDTACPHYTRRMGHDPNRGHLYRGTPQKRGKSALTPIQDGVKKVITDIPDTITINGRTFKEVKDK
jgi:hypothetical protein